VIVEEFHTKFIVF